MRELHSRRCAARSQRTQLGYISKHFAQWHFSLNNLRACTGIHTFHQTTTTVQVTSNITHVLLWSNYFYFHDWFQQNRLSLASSFAETLFSTKLERHRVGVNRVEATVEYTNLHVIYWIVGQHTGSHSRLETFLNRRYKFTRNSTTEDIVNKLEVLIRIFFLPIFIYRTDTE